jgi:hypothetical protein
LGTASRVRLALVSGTPRGLVDGAWWPRSADLSAEITLLVDAVSDAFAGRVVRVTYDRSVWVRVPRRLPYRGSYIHSGWFQMTEPHHITLVMLNGTRVVLLVIPPDLARDQGVWALQRAVEPGNHLSPDAILGNSSVPVAR